MLDLTPSTLQPLEVLAHVEGLNSKGGGAAIVQKFSHAPSNKKLVVKRYIIDNDNEEETIKLLRHEVVSMRQLRHAHLMECHASFPAPGCEVWLVEPWMEMGSARHVLDTFYPEGVPEMAATPILRDVLLALEHLHERGVVHRAVKASHVLIDAKGVAKLTGMRYCCSLYENTVGAAVTAAAAGCVLQDRYDYPLHVANKNLNWLSPEILQQNLLGYNEKSDLYSLGVTACELANGLVPFSEMPGTLMLLEKLRGADPKLLDFTTFEAPPDQPEQPQHPGGDNVVVFSGNQPADSGVGASVGSCSNLPKGSGTTAAESKLARQREIYSNRAFSDAFHDFVAACCTREADLRPSASSLLNHVFIKHLRKSSSSSLSIATLISTQTDTADKSNSNKNSNVSFLSEQLDSQLSIQDFQWDF